MFATGPLERISVVLRRWRCPSSCAWPTCTARSACSTSPTLTSTAPSTLATLGLSSDQILFGLAFIGRFPRRKKVENVPDGGFDGVERHVIDRPPVGGFDEGFAKEIISEKTSRAVGFIIVWPKGVIFRSMMTYHVQFLLLVLAGSTASSRMGQTVTCPARTTSCEAN